MSLLPILALAAVVTVAQAQSLTVDNKCTESVFLYTQNSFGTIDNNVNVAAGTSFNMGISSNWDGAINVGKSSLTFPILGALLTFLGTGCDSAGSCTTGGPTWDGVTPFSRAEFNFVSFQLEQPFPTIQYLSSSSSTPSPVQ